MSQGLFRVFRHQDNMMSVRLQVLIFCLGIKARTGFVDIGKVAVTQDLCLGMFPFESLEQVKQCSLLSDGPGIGCCAFLVKASFIAYTQRMAVVAPGMGTDELLMTCLGDGAVACDVVVVAREPEAIAMVADELHHGVSPIATGGGAVHNDEIDAAHNYIQLVTPSAVPMADSMLIPT